MDVRALPFGRAWTIVRGAVTLLGGIKRVTSRPRAYAREKGIGYVSTRLSSGSHINKVYANILLGPRNKFRDQVHAAADAEYWSVESLRSRITEAQATEGSDPPFSRVVADEPLLPLEGRRLALAFPRTIRGSGGVECDLHFHLARSAQQAGLDVLVPAPQENFESKDPRGLPRFDPFTPEEIQRFHPDMLLFDGGSVLTNSQVGPEILGLLSELDGATSASLMSDDWSTTYALIAQQWADVVDSVLFYDRSSTVEKALSGTGKGLQWLIPKATSSGLGTPPIFDVGFQGAWQRGRHGWLNEAQVLCREFGLSTDFDLFPRRLGGYGVMSSYEEHLERVTRARAIINLTQKSEREYIVNGRTFEAVVQGRLLLQQEGTTYSETPLRDFLAPFVHYIPIATLNHLGIALEWLEAYPDEVEQVSAAGRDFFVSTYAPTKLWSYLFSNVTRSA